MENMKDFDLNVILPTDFEERSKSEISIKTWMKDWINLISEERNKEEYDAFTELECLPGIVFKNLELVDSGMIKNNESDISETDLTFKYEYDDFNNMKNMEVKKGKLGNTIDFIESGWNKDKSIWTQPPVPIKHGDLVDIEYNGGISTVIGRYIGKGMGLWVSDIYYEGKKYHIGYVKNRGYNKMPDLPTDEEVFNHIED